MVGEKVGKRIKDTLTALVKKSADVVGNTTEATRNNTVETLRHVKGKKTEVSRHIAEEVVERAIDAGSEAGGELGSIAKGAVIGAVEGVGEVIKVDKSIISGVAKAAVKETGKVGGDMVAVAKKVVEGAIEVAERAGFKAEDAAYAAASGAREAAEETSETASTTISKVLSGTISGVRLVLGLPAKKPVILVANSNQANLGLLSQQLVKEGYDTLDAASLEELDERIRLSKKIALGLIDLSGFDQRIWERCEALRKARIPYIVISPQRSPLIQRESMKHGANGLLVKPLGIKELLEHIYTLTW